MTHPAFPLLTAAVLAALGCAAPPALAAPGGAITTMPTGRFDCERPGSAMGAAVRREGDAGFRLLIGSSYEADGINGVYLLTGDLLVMTSGPHKGRRFRRESGNALRELNPDGSETNLRCVRRAGNNR